MRGFTTVLDVGANIECDAEQPDRIRHHGRGVLIGPLHGKPADKRPTVGLLNVGSEDQKGHDEVREAHANAARPAASTIWTTMALSRATTSAKGAVEVIVTDGFTGNVALKTGEGLARFFADEMRSAFSSSLMAKAGAFLAMGALRRMRQRLNRRGAVPCSA